MLTTTVGATRPNSSCLPPGVADARAVLIGGAECGTRDGGPAA